MSAFEDYIYAELPLRTIMIRGAAAYGDPNASVSPGINNVANGTFYLRDDVSPRTLWLKLNSGATDWYQFSTSGGTVVTSTAYTLTTTFETYTGLTAPGLYTPLAHTGNTANPHQVTPEQISAYTIFQVDANFLSATTFIPSDFYSRAEANANFLSALTYLRDLADVNTGGTQTGYYLAYSAGTWIGVPDATDLSNYYNKQEVDRLITGATSGITLDLTAYYTSAQTNTNFLSANTFIPTSLTGLTDVILSGLTVGDVLTYNGIAWINSATTGLVDGITLTLSWKFSTTLTNEDPGNGAFRYNNVTPSAITEIYIDYLTTNGVDVKTVLSKIRTGTEIYIQQKNDSSKAILFVVTATTLDNTGWYTIPVVCENSIGTVPQNNKDCVFVVFSAPIIDSLSAYTLLSIFNDYTGITAINSFLSANTSFYTQAQVWFYYS